MKINFLRYLSALMLCLCFFSEITVAQNIQADAKLHNYSIKIGEQTKLFLVVHQPAKEQVTFPKLADTIISKVLVVGTYKSDTTFEGTDRSRMTVTRSYLITSFDAGTYTIPAFSIGTSGGVVKTSEQILQVSTVKVDTTKSIYDIKQPIAVSYNLWDWLKDNWYWVLLVLVLIAAGVGITWYLMNKPKKEPVIVEVAPIIPLHIQMLTKLQQLREKKLWQREEYKLYYSELSDVLREYLEKRYHIKTYEKTTEEIFSGLKHIQILEDQRARLHEVLVLSDLVKFAKQEPAPAENEQSMDYAMDFVEKTQEVPVVLPKPAQEGGANEPV